MIQEFSFCTLIQPVSQNAKNGRKKNRKPFLDFLFRFAACVDRAMQ